MRWAAEAIPLTRLLKMLPQVMFFVAMCLALIQGFAIQPRVRIVA